MRALQVIENGQPLIINDVSEPEPAAGEVIVKVAHCGLCHTDLHLHDGHFGLGGDKKLSLSQSLPLTMGHEIQGTVHRVGTGVSGLPIGDSVAVYPWIGCGDCGLCTTAREHLCARARAIGVNVAGGYAQYVRVPSAKYVLPIGAVDPRQAALLMCSGISAFSALSKVETAFAAGRVAIIGFGGLGHMAVALAKARFGTVPVVLDVNADKLAQARALGCEAFDLAADDAIKTIKRETGGISAVVDFVGSDATSQAAGRLCGQAGHIVVVGLFGGELRTPLPPLALRGTTIQGSYVGTLDDAKAVLELAATGQLNAIPVTDCTLDQGNDAFSTLRSGNAEGRIIFNIS
ncbi:MAG: alcohol dehydrogenase catalytic domain-containing protein [Pseudomonadota bacterium]